MPGTAVELRMFLDTNVLVLSRFEAAPNHSRARHWMRTAIEGKEQLRISRQVLREYLATVTRPQPWSNPVSMLVALDHVATLETNMEILEDGPDVTEMLVELCGTVPVAGKQVHDANIVATMLARGERRLMTFNATDFRHYGDRITLVDMEGTP